MKKSNLFAWASQSENGTINGEKGDQTKKEVKVGYYYNFGQDKVIRFKSLPKGRKCAEIAKILTTKPFLGYGQRDRTDFYSWCSACDWDWQSVLDDINNGIIPKCNIDCSMFSACCINLAFGKDMLPFYTTTRNILELTVNRYPQHFKKVTVNSFEKSPHKGDMPLKANKHIIINV